MPFCINCGQKLTEGANFCANCGSRVSDDETNQRKTSYEGEVRKCPNCGEVLESFSAHCPVCGIEFRGTKVSSSVQEFTSKLEAIEAQREEERKSGVFRQAAKIYKSFQIDKQKISLIKNFPIPNTKEDILEFMILATSNFEMSMYSYLERRTDRKKSMATAWNTKVKQTYDKAKKVYKSDKDFMEIQELYASCNKAIAKKKTKEMLKLALYFLVAICPFFLLIHSFDGLSNYAEAAEKKEIERLEAIVVEVQENLEQKEYKLALNNADSIDYQRGDTEMERKWDIQREYWVDKVIEQAKNEGIDLQYTPTPDIDNANEESADMK